jgi:hypothetical protein
LMVLKQTVVFITPITGKLYAFPKGLSII